MMIGLLALPGTIFSQGYQQPPKAIMELVDVPPTPALRIGPNGKWALLLQQSSMPSIEELAQPELRLAGLRINPASNGPSRSGGFIGASIIETGTGKTKVVAGLPQNVRMGNLSWSPDGKIAAFSHTTASGIELWLINVESAQAKQLTGPILNAVLGSPFDWLSDSRHILIKTVPEGRGLAPAEPKAPAGPAISFNEGKAAPARTYQDLLKDSYDEALFEYFAQSQLVLMDIQTSAGIPLGPTGMIASMEPSPDGKYVLASFIKRPFSYLVPVSSFPVTYTLFDQTGAKVTDLADLPLAEDIPTAFDAVRKGPRSISWRPDKDAELYWVEAQDEGDPRIEATVRDRLYVLSAPFTGTPQAMMDFSLRFRSVSWGDGQLAIASERWWRTRREVVTRFSPEQPGAKNTVLFDRSYEDRYGDPGQFMMTQNAAGRSVLLSANNGKTLFLNSMGASPEGNRPFVDAFDLASGQSKRLWRSEAPYYEMPLAMLDAAKSILLTSRESRETPPNYYLRNLSTRQLTPLTQFENPYKALKGVTKEMVAYERKDGLKLSGTLYLPAGYDRSKDGPLPVFMWAYPREYKTADAASQINGSPFQFIRPGTSSPLLWVTQGYAVFDDFAMPILGEGDKEPNETFVEQLQMSAEAAVDKLVGMGVADRKRLAVGGHSYGAFMTANLLAHTDLFAAGIARSGAYNRTLTPFGFQQEERTYWEAPDVYHKMSPFNYADKIKEPILLIHGEADNNSGTFPIQSERFYNALKGHGATAKLVFLPHESHGYQARESILHTLHEMNAWMDKYVKNKQGGGAVRP
jgi:dipeptidyl aminopeptidase/acylaminoacyl peptidase